jgi:peptidoglycan/xylan/chitin deacetylase (PgdA/CDA1 family)
MMVKEIFYIIKPLIPRHLQIFMRRQLISVQRRIYKNRWPIDEKSARPPAGWRGWPGEKQFAFVITHDVESASGYRKSRNLKKIDLDRGFRSSFNFVPEGYTISHELLDEFKRDGFEIGVHGLNHDGKLYSSRSIFQERSILINRYIEEWKASGFRSPSMHFNLEWIHDLAIDYDASTFDTDPFEPQPDGMRTIFPFWVPEHHNGRGYVELPYTLPQDFTLFILMQEKSIDVWKRKLDWIAEKGGMVLLNAHPDYMAFNGEVPGLEEYPVENYINFLRYIEDQYSGRYWQALPREVACFWKSEFGQTKVDL